MGRIRDHMELPGFAGGLEQLPGLAGEDLFISGPLYKEDRAGRQDPDVPAGIMPVKIAEKTGPEEELPGVVPARDSASRRAARNVSLPRIVVKTAVGSETGAQQTTPWTDGSIAAAARATAPPRL